MGLVCQLQTNTVSNVCKWKHLPGQGTKTLAVNQLALRSGRSDAVAGRRGSSSDG